MKIIQLYQVIKIKLKNQKIENDNINISQKIKNLNKELEHVKRE